MKAIFNDTVTKHICLLCEKFHPMKIDQKQIKVLMDFYRNTTEKVSDEELEKVIACIYALQEKGIPLKASSIELGVDINKTLKLFKKLRTPSIKYVPLFIDLLKTGYQDGMKERFDSIFNKLAPEFPDHFALATVINMELKRNHNKYFGYSEVTIIRYRKMVREEMKHG